MKRPFAATVWREGKWYVSQCLELDLASQGETEEKALASLKEARGLHLEPPRATFHKAASQCIGTLAGRNPRRAESASRIVKERLRRRRCR
jgi:hypothetical protein